jgi:hypothetical protein
MNTDLVMMTLVSWGSIMSSLSPLSYRGKDRIGEEHTSVHAADLLTWSLPGERWRIKTQSVHNQLDARKRVISSQQQQNNKWHHHHARNKVWLALRSRLIAECKHLISRGLVTLHARINLNREYMQIIYVQKVR